MNKNFLVIVLILFFSLILLSCENADRDYNWAVKNNGEKVCGVRGIEGIDIGIEGISYDWEEKPMIIAVVDTGVTKKTCKDFEGIILYADDTEMDSNHSMCVIGIISTNSNSDYQSVLKDAPIYNISIDENNIDVQRLIKDLTIAESKGIKVVNVSFTMNYFSEELYYFMKNSEMLFVCAAGNEHKEYVAYPAGFELENVISVIGINNWGYCSQYSNYSSKADIAAPGENILCISGNGEYEYYSGTSFAAPFVTACSAYLISEIECTAGEAKDIIKSCGQKIEELDGYVDDGRMLSMKNLMEYIEKY